MLNPVRLRTFVEVMRTGSFAVAARRLRYTPSAVSQQISSLERSTQLQLFVRDSRGITATPTAHLLLQSTEAALGELQLLEDQITRLADGETGLLRVGSFPTASQRLVPLTLSNLASSHPNLTVALDEGEPSDLLAQLSTREIDVALCYAYDLVPESPKRWPPRDALIVEKVLLVLPESHSLADRPTIALKELSEETWVSTRAGTAAATLLARLCTDAGFMPKVTLQSNDYSVIYALVAANRGIAMIPALGRQTDLGTRTVRIHDKRALRRVFIVTQGDPSATSTGSFVDAVREAARELAQGDDYLALA